MLLAEPSTNKARLQQPQNVRHHIMHTDCVEKAQLQGKDHSVGDFDVAVEVLHVLESLQVQGQDLRQFLHSHPATLNTGAHMHTVKHSYSTHSGKSSLLITDIHSYRSLKKKKKNPSHGKSHRSYRSSRPSTFFLGKIFLRASTLNVCGFFCLFVCFFCMCNEVSCICPATKKCPSPLLLEISGI